MATPAQTRRSVTAPDAPCPIARAASVVGDLWNLLILRNATTGTSRFDAFRAQLGIADNVLANRLKRLVDAGLLTRVPYREGGRTRHEYRLTEAGADLLPILEALAAWGERYTAPGIATGPTGLVHLSCGEPLGPDHHCARCERHVPREELAWLRPWLSPEPTPLAMPVD
jgi:DNA-binding HxlR family transcriptional regulator